MSNTNPLGANQVLKKVYNESLDALDVNLKSNEASLVSTGTHTRPSITNSSSTILAANTSRKYAFVFNNNGFTAYLKLGTTAVVNEGIALRPNETYSINRDNLWTGSITAIKGTATAANLDVFEGT